MSATVAPYLLRRSHPRLCTRAAACAQCHTAVCTIPACLRANEAALVLPAVGAVQIVAVGATPPATALLGASVIACTAGELLSLLYAETDGDVAGVVDAVLSQVRRAAAYGVRAARGCE